MAGEDYIIRIIRDITELEILEKELEGFRKRELEALKTANKAITDEQQNLTNYYKAQFKERQILLNNFIKEEIRLRKESNKQEYSNVKSNEQSSQSGNVDKIIQGIKDFGSLSNTVSTTSTELVKYEQNLKSLSYANDNLFAQIKTGDTELQKFNNSVSTTGIDLLGTAGIVFQIAKAFIDISLAAVKAGSELETLREGLDKVTGSAEGSQQAIELFNIASAGNLNEKELLQYYNTFKLLGFTVNDTAKFLDIVDLSAKNAGVSFNETMQVLENFISTGQDSVELRMLGFNLAIVEAKMQELSGKTIEEINNLDDYDQQSLRFRAVLDLNGRSIEKLGGKINNNTTNVNVLSKSWDNFFDHFGIGILEQFEGELERFGDTTQTVNSKASKFGETIGNIFAEIIKWGPALGWQIGNMITDGFTFLINETIKDFNKLRDDFNRPAPSTFSDSVDNQLQNNINTVDDLRKSYIQLGDELKQNPIDPKKILSKEMIDYFIPPEQTSPTKEAKKAIIDLENDPNTKTNRNRISNTEHEIDLLSELINSIKTTIKLEQLIGNARKNSAIDIKTISGDILNLKVEELNKNINLIQTDEDRIKFLEIQLELRKQIAETYAFRAYSPLPKNEPSLKPPTMPEEVLPSAEKEIWEALPGGDEGADLSEAVNDAQGIADILGLASHTFIQQLLDGLNSAIGLVNNIMSLFNNLSKGGGFLSLFSSLLSFIPGIGPIAATGAGLATAAFGGGRAEGGEVQLGKSYLVGERGMELFIPRTNGYIFSNKELMKMASNGQNRSTANVMNNIYLNASVNAELIVTKGLKAMNQSNRYKKVA